VSVPEKTKGSVPGAPARKRSKDDRELLRGLPCPVVQTEHTKPTTPRGRLERLVLTQELAAETDLGDDAKLVLAAFAPHRHRPPTRAEILVALPFLTNNRLAAAIREIAQKRYAFVDRSRNRHGKPIRLQPTTPQADTRRSGAKLIHIPTAPLDRLSRRTAARDTLLFGLMHAEQRRARGYQLSDETAAAMLAWPRRTVAVARKRLLTAGLIVQVADRGNAPSIYAIPEALANAEARFDPDCIDASCSECFREERTRSLHPLVLGSELTLRMLATTAQAELADERITDATGDDLERFYEWARGAAADSRAYVESDEVFAALPGDEEYADNELRRAELIDHRGPPSPDDPPLSDADIPF
jgi:hypothetical protein